MLVSVFPRWWWVRCSCLLGAICMWIKWCLLSNYCWWRKVCGYIFFVLWYPLLHLWLNCWFLQWFCTLRFSVGIFLVGAYFFIPTIALIVGMCGAVDGYDIFVVAFLWFETCYLQIFILFLLKILAWGGGYDWGSVCLLDLRSPHLCLMLRICCKEGWTKLYSYSCV